MCGKRIKNIALHKESLNMLDRENKLLQKIRQEESMRLMLLREIQQLGNIIDIQDYPEEDEKGTLVDMGPVNSGVLHVIMEEQAREQELLELKYMLHQQLASLADSHHTLVQKYTKLTCQAPEFSSKETVVPENSSKTISTEGDEPSL